LHLLSMSGSILPLISEVLKKRAPLHKNPKKMWRFFIDFVHFRVFFNKFNAHGVAGIKFNSCRAFVIAANSLDIPTIAIQHGDYYYDGCKRLRSHEWPATHLFVNDSASKNYCEKVFSENQTYHVMGGPLWIARYDNSDTIKKNMYIVFYESQQSEIHDELIKLAIEQLPKWKVKIKPHPYRLWKEESSAVKKFKEYIYTKELWQEVPYIGISFGSTVTNEIIYLDSPCITVVSQKTNKNQLKMFPKSGTYVLNEKNIPRIIGYINTLEESTDAYNSLLEKQKKEFIVSESMVPSISDRIAQAINRIIES